MLDPKIKDKVALTYAKIGDIAYSIALNLRKGKDYTSKQKDLKDRGRKILFYLKIILRHVDTSVTPPVLYRITAEEVNKLLRCIEKIGNIESFPMVPSLFPQPKPIILNKGLDGTDGEDGEDGSDANIIVEAAPGESEVIVTPVVILGITHYRIGFTPYTELTLLVAVQGTKIFEIGVIVPSFNINITTTKGSSNITAITIDNHTDLNDDLQGILDLDTVNGVTQPVVNFVTDQNVEEDTDYIVTATDGQVPQVVQDGVRFYYPFLYGASDITGITHYSALTKEIAAKANKSFNLNGTNKYFWIGYPASYGSLARIRDQNGFVVTDDFTEVTANVTSIGLDNNWTVSYKFYRTTVKTTINNQPYSIEF